MALAQGAFYKAFGKRLREARKANRLTQTQLAKALGLSRPSIANIEAGKQPVHVHTLLEISRMFGKTYEEFIPTIQSTGVHPVLSEVSFSAQNRKWVEKVLTFKLGQETAKDGTSVFVRTQESGRIVAEGKNQETASSRRKTR